MRKDRLRVGVITEPINGHLVYWFNSLANSQEIEQVAVADQTGQAFGEPRDSLGKYATDLLTFGDYRQMLEDFRPELVLVSLEAHHAPQPIAAALEAGAHVLAEKPACVDPREFERLVHLSEEKGRHLMLAFANRLIPTVVKARELLQSGFLGKWYAVDMHTIADQTRLQSRDYQQSWYGFKEKAGGGHLTWLGIHYLDLIQFITGVPVREVCGFTHNVGETPIEVEDSAVVAMRFENGRVGTLHSGYYLDHSYDCQIVVWGSQGWLRFSSERGSYEAPLQWYSTHADAPKGVQTFEFTPEPESTVGYQAFIHSGIRAALGLQPPPVTGQESLQALKLVFGLYRAAETGRTQTIS